MVANDVAADDLIRSSCAPQIGVLTIVRVVSGFGEDVGWRGFLVERRLRGELPTQRLARRDRVGSAARPARVDRRELPRSLGALRTVGWAVGLAFGSLLLAWMYRAAGHS